MSLDKGKDLERPVFPKKVENLLEGNFGEELEKALFVFNEDPTIDDKSPQAFLSYFKSSSTYKDSFGVGHMQKNEPELLLDLDQSILEWAMQGLSESLLVSPEDLFSDPNFNTLITEIDATLGHQANLEEIISFLEASDNPQHKKYLGILKGNQTDASSALNAKRAAEVLESPLGKQYAEAKERAKKTCKFIGKQLDRSFAAQDANIQTLMDKGDFDAADALRQQYLEDMNNTETNYQAFTVQYNLVKPLRDNPALKGFHEQFAQAFLGPFEKEFFTAVESLDFAALTDINKRYEAATQTVLQDAETFKKMDQISKNPQTISRTLDMLSDNNVLPEELDNDQIGRFLAKLGGDFKNSNVAEIMKVQLGPDYIERVNSAFNQRMEQNNNRADQLLEQRMQEAKGMSFRTREEGEQFIMGGLTDFLNGNPKPFPDKYWDKTAGPRLRNQVKSFLDDSNQVNSIQNRKKVAQGMKGIKLSPDDLNNCKTERDYYEIGKRKLAGLHGLVSDDKWDVLMQQHFYPKMGEQLKQNTVVVRKGMTELKAPTAAEMAKFKSPEDLQAWGKIKLKKLHGKVPDSVWNTAMEEVFYGRMNTLWAGRTAEKEKGMNKAANELRDAVKGMKLTPDLEKRFVKGDFSHFGAFTQHLKDNALPYFGPKMRLEDWNKLMEGEGSPFGSRALDMWQQLQKPEESIKQGREALANPAMRNGSLDKMAEWYPSGLGNKVRHFMVEVCGVPPNRVGDLQNEINAYTQSVGSEARGKVEAAQSLIDGQEFPANIDRTDPKYASFAAFRAQVADWPIDSATWAVVGPQAEAKIKGFHAEYLKGLKDPEAVKLAAIAGTSLENHPDYLKKWGILDDAALQGMKPKGLERLNQLMSRSDIGANLIEPQYLKKFGPFMIDVLAAHTAESFSAAMNQLSQAKVDRSKKKMFFMNFMQTLTLGWQESTLAKRSGYSGAVRDFNTTFGVSIMGLQKSAEDEKAPAVLEDLETAQAAESVTDNFGAIVETILEEDEAGDADMVQPPQDDNTGDDDTVVDPNQVLEDLGIDLEGDEILKDQPDVLSEAGDTVLVEEPIEDFEAPIEMVDTDLEGDVEGLDSPELVESESDVAVLERAEEVDEDLEDAEDSEMNEAGIDETLVVDEVDLEGDEVLEMDDSEALAVLDSVVAEDLENPIEALEEGMEAEEIIEEGIKEVVDTYESEPDNVEGDEITEEGEDEVEEAADLALPELEPIVENLAEDALNAEKADDEIFELDGLEPAVSEGVENIEALVGVETVTEKAKENTMSQAVHELIDVNEEGEVVAGGPKNILYKILVQKGFDVEDETVQKDLKFMELLPAPESLVLLSDEQVAKVINRAVEKRSVSGKRTIAELLKLIQWLFEFRYKKEIALDIKLPGDIETWRVENDDDFLVELYEYLRTLDKPVRLVADKWKNGEINLRFETHTGIVEKRMACEVE